jgi:hypothetical protein
MFRRSDDQAVMAPARIVAFDRARTWITMLVLLHHSVLNYTVLTPGRASFSELVIGLIFSIAAGILVAQAVSFGVH